MKLDSIFKELASDIALLVALCLSASALFKIHR